MRHVCAFDCNGILTTGTARERHGNGTGTARERHGNGLLRAANGVRAGKWQETFFTTETHGLYTELPGFPAIGDSSKDVSRSRTMPGLQTALALE